MPLTDGLYLGCCCDDITASPIDDIVISITELSDGSIVICGNFYNVGGISRLGLALLDNDLNLLTPSWDLYYPNFPSLGFSFPRLASADAADRIYVFGEGWTQLDVLAIPNLAQVLKTGGQAIRAGSTDLSGYYDPAFGPQPFNAPVTGVFWDVGSSRLIISGLFSLWAATTANGLFALNPVDGTQDVSFNYPVAGKTFTGIISDGGTGFYIWGSIFQRVDSTGAPIAGFTAAVTNPVTPHGVILMAAGVVSSSLTGFGGLLTRMNATTGAKDLTFNPGGAGFDVGPYTLCANGTSILCGGGFSHYNGVLCTTNLAQVLTNGAIDPAWTCNTDGTVYHIIKEAAGTFLIGGAFNTVGGKPRSKLARIDSTGNVL